MQRFVRTFGLLSPHATPCGAPLKGALVALGSTLATCTACHQSYKQQVVDAPRWSALTGQVPPHHAP